MGLWDKLKAELIDIVEWLDGTNDTLRRRVVGTVPEMFTALKYGDEKEYKFAAGEIAAEVPLQGAIR